MSSRWTTATSSPWRSKPDGTAFGWGEVDDEVKTVPSEYNTGVLSVAAGETFGLALLEEID